MTEQQDQDPVRGGDAASDAADSPAGPIHVAWFAGDETLERFARVLQPMVIGLADELVKITLFRAGSTGDNDALGPGVETMRYRTRRLLAPGARAVDDLAERIRTAKIDLLHALDADSADLVAKVAGQADRQYIVSSHAMGDGVVLGTLGAQCAAVLASSTGIRNDLIIQHVAAAEKIHLVKPGIYRVRAPTCFCEPGHSVAIVAAGPMDSLGPWRAVLRTFAELRMREFDCLFFIAGAGQGERKTRRLARQLDLLGHVTFIDEQVASQFAGIVRAADVYISATASQTLDIRTLLAMANGSAVLAARDETADFIVDGQTALVFEQGNPAELTTKLVAMLDDPQAARDLAEAALAYVAEHHSPATSVAALVEIYHNVTDRADQASATSTGSSVPG